MGDTPDMEARRARIEPKDPHVGFFDRFTFVRLLQWVKKFGSPRIPDPQPPPLGMWVSDEKDNMLPFRLLINHLNERGTRG